MAGDGEGGRRVLRGTDVAPARSTIEGIDARLRKRRRELSGDAPCGETKERIQMEIDSLLDERLKLMAEPVPAKA